MGQIAGSLLWYRPRCRHAPESLTLIFPMMWQKKNPVQECLLLIYTDILDLDAQYVIFLSLQPHGKSKPRLYITGLVSIIRTKSLTCVPCTPQGYVFLCGPQWAIEYLPPGEGLLPQSSKADCPCQQLQRGLKRTPSADVLQSGSQYPPGKTN